MTVHHQERLRAGGAGPGLFDVTAQVAAVVARSGVRTGLATCFIRHTSASLVIQENADPRVLSDLRAFLARLVPEDGPYSHLCEGPDDMPAHVKAALTSVSIGIPVGDGSLLLGTWQGIFLWEHRRLGQRREIVVHVTGEPT